MSEDEQFISILSFHGGHASQCGYCGPWGQRSAASSSISIGATPSQLSCTTYQKMMDRGWRRSGQYVYQPTMIETCCCQYPIRLDATQFEPTRNQRKALYKFNRFIIDGEDGGEDDKKTESAAAPVVNGEHTPANHGVTKQPVVKPKPRKQVFSLVDAVHEPEAAFREESSGAKHKFEVTVEPATYTEEKFELYKDYQRHVHNEPDREPYSFKGFLCDTDLTRSSIPYTTTPPAHLPKEYGTHHQLYRIDGELVAMSVLDILPSSLSGVYFMYKEKWEKCQLGKLSILREAALAREMHAAGLKQLTWLYLGFYIHSCQKMRYKGEYSPSFLLDPETYEWYPLKECVPLLEKARYACFSDPSHSSQEIKKPTIPEIEQQELTDVLMLYQANGVLLSQPLTDMDSRSWQKHKARIWEAIHALGRPLASRIFFYFG